MQFGMYMMHIASMFLLRSSPPQYSHPSACAQSGFRSDTMVASSAAFTDPCSDGSLRNHVCQTATQTRPTAPKHTKIIRQGMNVSSQSTSTGVSPPTRWAPAKKTP